MESCKTHKANPEQTLAALLNAIDPQPLFEHLSPKSEAEALWGLGYRVEG